MTTQEKPGSSPSLQETSDTMINNKRNRTLMIVSLALASIGIGYVTYWLSYGRYHEYTDDAYVNGNAVMITAQVPGIITKIYAQDSDFVSKDTPLVQLDTTDHEISLEKVKKQLAETVREIAKLFADAGKLEAEIEEKKAIFVKNALDYERRVSLIHTGSISQENFDHALSDMASTYYNLIATEQAFYGVMAQIENTSIQDHPKVETVKQLVRQAWVNLRRCTLYAPVTGIIAQRTIQVGRWVEPTQPMLSVVPLEQMWVDANFKEIQLSHMRVGQPVTFHVDMYGRRVKFSGTIAGIGGGTGSVFSALPPQNATGNWIKIVQRIPVRIDIPQATLQEYPLRLGLSVEATVTTKDRSGSMTPNMRPVDIPLFATNIYDKEEEGVDQVIEDIIQTNLSI
jgi:membrane fusion protein (multidrug efflux system)